MEITFEVEHYDTAVIGIAHVDVLVVYKHTGGLIESIRNALRVYKRGNLEFFLIVAVHADYTVLRGVYKIYVHVRIDEQIAGILKSEFDADIIGIDNKNEYLADVILS
jgi:hypothetical protein